MNVKMFNPLVLMISIVLIIGMSVTLTGCVDIRYTLDLEVEGEGNVLVEWNDEKENITNSDSLEIEEETKVNLTAEAEEGWYFVGWSGDGNLRGEETIIEIDQNKEVTAEFEEENSTNSVDAEGTEKIDYQN